MDFETKQHLEFRFLPCLRCGLLKVTALLAVPAREVFLEDLRCKDCCIPHFLRVWMEGDETCFQYDRDTRRYPSEFYAEPPDIKVVFRDVVITGQDDSPFPGRGPIKILKRKRFSKADLLSIWQQSRHSCHICRKEWKLAQHGQRGWHVDHVVPNVGGGEDTEDMSNFLVACARCNLKKGRGYTGKLIREALGLLITPAT